MSAPWRWLTGMASALIAYPLAERLEKRHVREKWAALRAHYALPYPQRKALQAKRLAEIASFAGQTVPYYRDLFASLHFDPEKLERDTGYLNDLPYLTKAIVREQGARLYSRPLGQDRHHVCKTGGSTGLPCQIMYDQEAADWSAAVTLYCRERIGKKKWHTEAHFASRFPEVFPLKDRLRESVKCFAMNRANIFFDRLDDAELEAIWRHLRKLKAKLVHGHPSTLYALACHVRKTRGKDKAFDIFESSGEWLQPAKRKAIQEALSCRVIDRYGLAEFGVIAYQLDLGNPSDISDTSDKGQPDQGDEPLLALDSEGWMETFTDPACGQSDDPCREIVFTGFRNRLMPLVRYRTGDCATLVENEDGMHLTAMMGRLHDFVPIHGATYPTHYLQDVLDRVGGVQEFQIDLGHDVPLLRIVPEEGTDCAALEKRLRAWWSDGLSIAFVQAGDLVRSGWRSKFRHVVGTPS